MRARSSRRGLTQPRAVMAAVRESALFLLLLCAAAGPARGWDQPGETRGAGVASLRPSWLEEPPAPQLSLPSPRRGHGRGLSVPSGLRRTRGRAGARAREAFWFALPCNRRAPQQWSCCVVSGGYVLWGERPRPLTKERGNRRVPLGPSGAS